METIESLASILLDAALTENGIAYVHEHVDAWDLDALKYSMGLYTICYKSDGDKCICTPISPTSPETLTRLLRMISQQVTLVKNRGYKDVKVMVEVERDDGGMVLILRVASTSTTGAEQLGSLGRELETELLYQKTKKFGGNTEEFDKKNTKNDWVAYISAYAGRAAANVARNEREGCEFRASMLKVAALAISAIRSYDKGYC